MYWNVYIEEHRWLKINSPLENPENNFLPYPQRTIVSLPHCCCNPGSFKKTD